MRLKSGAFLYSFLQVPQSYHTFKIKARPVTWEHRGAAEQIVTVTLLCFVFLLLSKNYKITDWKIVKELLRHILAKKLAAVFHSPLDNYPTSLFPLIAEQPTTPYPEGIT